MKKQFAPLFVIALAVLASCNNAPKTTAVAAEPDALAANIDSTVRPQDDFFMFANGKWFKNHPIPASEKQNGLWE
ncbi:MAG TPA: M13 family peptidase, partial [Bacteroidia bacterium]|nr:M13 family peptidase [Bacteroidia bacterium]